MKKALPGVEVRRVLGSLPNAQCLTVCEIAEKSGLSETSVRRVLKSAKDIVCHERWPSTGQRAYARGYRMLRAENKQEKRAREAGAPFPW